MNFSSLGLSKQLLTVIEQTGYKTPTPIQIESIPAILSGRNVMAASQTGTGKTAAFSLPIVEILSSGQSVKSNQVHALILVPTRELAAQVANSFSNLCSALNLSYEVVFGGVKINPQMMKLRKGVDILIATPGRLLDLYKHNAIQFQQLKILVLDEADRMLDLGFSDEIHKILNLLPEHRQNLIFSATLSAKTRMLAKGIISNPLEIDINPKITTTLNVDQWLYPVDTKRKSALLAHLIKANNWQQVLVFCKTRQETDNLVRYLEKKNIIASAIHGDKSQNARTTALANFKQGIIQVLVATDLAARGLDITGLPQVVNYDLPHIIEDYIHRIGRTGRAELKGEAISLVSAEEFVKLGEIERLIKSIITRKVIAKFEPVNKLPESILDTRPIKPKKPKKTKHPI